MTSGENFRPESESLANSGVYPQSPGHVPGGCRHLILDFI